MKKVKCAPRQFATFDGSHFQVTQRITFNGIQLKTIAVPLRLRNTQAAYLSTIGEIFACTIAACNGTPRLPTLGRVPRGVEHLRTLLYECRDIFRVSIGRDPPVRVEPLRARLSEGVLPVRRSALGGYQSPPRIVSKRKTGV
ncbi:hypothetical protein PHMEG_00025786 [Phytophthora megakarya]|uniref:Uncharacterized protein n=1 Tax=Phytophthora megakarya TaxID=4795 RepID=A0A225VB71_9STRA|nr:hypothetical protein PHMEG_00025786 [Phytophthora megakarya]